MDCSNCRGARKKPYLARTFGFLNFGGGAQKPDFVQIEMRNAVLRGRAEAKPGFAEIVRNDRGGAQKPSQNLGARRSQSGMFALGTLLCSLFLEWN